MLLVVALLVTLSVAACGGSSTPESGTSAERSSSGAATRSDEVPGAPISGKLPRGAAGPVETAKQAAEGPAATEASPESAAEGPSPSGELPSSDRSAVTVAVDKYIAALDGRDAGRVCALIEPGSLDLGDLPERRGGCRSSLRASLGVRPARGGPAWRRTALVQAQVERLADDRARVRATVTHHFSDRKYVSVEDDVIYVQRVGGSWLLAKPSATFYRAVGYAQPPLRAFTPPPGW